MLKKPKMIWFDYGQTLVKEANFDGVKGTEAVLQYAVTNKYDLTAAQVQAEAEKINQELGRFDPAKRHLFQVEVPNHMFTAYLYESLGIQLSIGSEEIDRVFWDAAAPGVPTEGIESFLEFLYQNDIRTGVLSNISYAGTVVEERISKMLPNHHFEFIIATSEYMYRKPHKRIFEFILEKSELRPEEVWYIGDQYQCDVVGAKSVGIAPIWYRGAIDTPYEEKEDVLRIADWKELQAMLM